MKRAKITATIAVSMPLLFACSVQPTASGKLEVSASKPDSERRILAVEPAPEPWSPGQPLRKADWSRYKPKFYLEHRKEPHERMKKSYNLLWASNGYYYGSYTGAWADSTYKPATGSYARFAYHPNFRCPNANYTMYTPTMTAPNGTCFEISQKYTPTGTEFLVYNWSDSSGYTWKYDGSDVYSYYGAIASNGTVSFAQDTTWVGNYCYGSGNDMYYYVLLNKAEGTDDWFVNIYNRKAGVWDNIARLTGNTRITGRYGWDMYETYGETPGTCINLGTANAIYSDTLKVYGRDSGGSGALGWTQASRHDTTPANQPQGYGFATAGECWDNPVGSLGYNHDVRVSSFDHWQIW